MWKRTWSVFRTTPLWLCGVSFELCWIAEEQETEVDDTVLPPLKDSIFPPKSWARAVSHFGPVIYCWPTFMPDKIVRERERGRENLRDIEQFWQRNKTLSRRIEKVLGGYANFIAALVLFRVQISCKSLFSIILSRVLAKYSLANHLSYENKRLCTCSVFHRIIIFAEEQECVARRNCSAKMGKWACALFGPFSSAETLHDLIGSPLSSKHV